MEDIDTDQILPARFMTNARRVDLAHALFRDWKDGEQGLQTRSLDEVEPGSHRILVAGRNFGAGSSREHAVWALVDRGFRVVISSEIGSIFAGNAARNGLLSIEVPAAVNSTLLAAQGEEADVDLVGCTLTVPAMGLAHRFEVDPFTRTCLIEGLDPLSYLLGQRVHLAGYMDRPPAPSPCLTRVVSDPGP